jgi:iron complex outermembrane receptor protein
MSTVTRTPFASLPFGAVALLSLLSSAAAQTGAPPEPDTLVLSPFVVQAATDHSYGAATAYTATRIGVPILETPLNVQVVTRDLIDDQGARSLLQALRYSSGLSGDSLSFDVGNQNSSGSGSTIRGFIPTLILQNGFRRTGTMNVENVERVEIVKGPASVFFGQAAPGGLINVITRKPSQTRSATLDYTYGSYDFHKVRADFTGPVAGRKDLEYRLAASYQDSEDWRDYTYTKQTVVAPSLRWRPTADLMVGIDYEFVESERNFVPYSPFGSPEFLADWAAPPAAVLNFLGMTAAQAQARWLSNQNQWIEDKTSATGVRPYRITSYLPALSPRGYEWNPGGPDSFTGRRSHSLTVESTYKVNDVLSLRYGGNNYYVKLRRVDASIAIPRGDGTINLALQNNKARDEWWTHQVDALIQHDLPFVKNKLTVGMQYTHNDSVPQNALNATFNTAAVPSGTIVTAFNPFTMPPIRLGELTPYTFQPTPSGSIQRNYTRGYGASWFAEWFDSRLTTMAGVRREEDIRQRLGGAGLPTLERTATVPTYGANLRVAPGIAIFASYSENFAPNSIRSAEGPGLLPSDNATDLPVELGKGFDFGLKADWNDHKISGSLSFFQVERTNVPRADTAKQAADPRNLAGLFGPTGVRFNSSGGLERTRGTELDLLYHPTLNYQLLVSVTWMWEAKVAADPSVLPGTWQYDRTFNQNRRLRNSPEFLASVWSKYDFISGALTNWSIGLGVRHSSEVEPRATDLTSYMFNPSFTVIDLMVGYKTKFGATPVNFTLNVENLADKLYFEGNTAAADPRKISLRTSVRF